jgi:hypothetical protein
MIKKDEKGERGMATIYQDVKFELEERVWIIKSNTNYDNPVIPAVIKGITITLEKHANNPHGVEILYDCYYRNNSERRSNRIYKTYQEAINVFGKEKIAFHEQQIEKVNALKKLSPEIVCKNNGVDFVKQTENWK